MAIVVICGYLAYQAESPVNDLFASYRDAAWWSVVTLTTQVTALHQAIAAIETSRNPAT
jgi:hypothetical protein